jgi:hypothetical protein
MNNQEAKFILGAYRPDGRDAADPMFAEALAQAERDPDLRAWLERQRRFDSEVAGKLREIAPPPGLRDAILAGVRVSQRRRSWWQNPWWLATAAVIAVMAALTVQVRRAEALPTPAEFSAFALHDLAAAHDDHVGYPPELADLQGSLMSGRLPLTEAVGIDVADLQRRRCRSVLLAGREVFEICFPRDGTWYHLYVARRSDFRSVDSDPGALVSSRGEYASAVWADSKNIYALVARGTEAVRRVI